MPENPLDAIMYAWNNFSWSSDNDRIIIVITDIYAHQSTDTSEGSCPGDNRCTISGEAVINELSGNGIIYAISPDFTSILDDGFLDVRRLADGLGEGRTTPLSNTGGKWYEYTNIPAVDLVSIGLVDEILENY